MEDKYLKRWGAGRTEYTRYTWQKGGGRGEGGEEGGGRQQEGRVGGIIVGGEVGGSWRQHHQIGQRNTQEKKKGKHDAQRSNGLEEGWSFE